MKRVLDMHTNIATSLLEQIKVDIYLKKHINLVQILIDILFLEKKIGHLLRDWRKAHKQSYTGNFNIFLIFNKKVFNSIYI